ncbi:hypothetical protein MRX96_003443 [Rhipicephalus microplus]
MVFRADRLLTVARPLAVLPESLVLNITASDNGSPRRSAHQELHVHRSEAPQRPPRFDESHYAANVSEDAPVGTTVLVVRASGGRNLSYSLPTGGGHFGVDAHTGVVHTLALLDREVQVQHEFVMFVTDDQNQVDSCLVLVRLLDVNDQSPEFDDSCRGLAVPENGPPELHTLVAWDRDEGPNARILYSITGEFINH